MQTRFNAIMQTIPSCMCNSCFLENLRYVCRNDTINSNLASFVHVELMNIYRILEVLNSDFAAMSTSIIYGKITNPR